MVKDICEHFLPGPTGWEFGGSAALELSGFGFQAEGAARQNIGSINQSGGI